MLLQFFSALYPVNQETDTADRNTREFLRRVIDILLDYVTTSNDRSKKILDFHHPEQMKESIDLKIPDKPLNLDQLLVDCKDTMKYGVRTGKSKLFFNFNKESQLLLYMACNSNYSIVKDVPNDKFHVYNILLTIDPSFKTNMVILLIYKLFHYQR